MTCGADVSVVCPPVVRHRCDVVNQWRHHALIGLGYKLRQSPCGFS